MVCQLNPSFVSEENQKQNVRLLRTKVVEYIKENFEVFKGDLEKRITESGRKFTRAKIREKECHKFLNHLGTDDGSEGIETSESKL